MGNPMVSIITPSYKSKKHIRNTIESVLKQTYDNYEMIIVDDASPDGSANFIESILPDARFKLIRLDNNIGAAEARNIALQNSKGKLIAFLDSDDIWHPSKLEKQISFMTNNNISFCFSSYDLISESGNDLGKIIRSKKKIDFNGYMKNTIIGCLTVMIDKEKIKPFLMPNLRSSHDMALWGDIMRNNNIVAYGIDEVLASYRIVKNSNTSNKLKAAKDVWAIYRHYYKFNITLSTWYFINYAVNAILKRL